MTTPDPHATQRALSKALADRDRAREVAVALEQQLARVEKLTDQWGEWARFRSTPRIDAFRDAANDIRRAIGADQ